MKHIVIVDDEPLVREILREVLRDAGYRVTDLATAAEALQRVREDVPDLIVTDLQLEEMDGFAFIEQVKHLLPKVPVVLLTGVLFDAAVTRRLGAEQVSGYVAKTAPLNHLLSEIKRHLGG